MKSETAIQYQMTSSLQAMSPELNKLKFDMQSQINDYNNAPTDTTLIHLRNNLGRFFTLLNNCEERNNIDNVKKGKLRQEGERMEKQMEQMILNGQSSRNQHIRDRESLLTRRGGGGGVKQHYDDDDI